MSMQTGNERVRSELPIAIRATASWARSRWLRRSERTFRYDARFADGREERGLDRHAVDRLLQGARYPADTDTVLRGAESACPDDGIGPWVDYPWGRPL